MTLTVADIEALHADPRRCAELAGLHYVDGEQPGTRRRRHGRGFSYLDYRNRPVAAAEKERIVTLAIPPAWRSVWICPTADGHILATGADARDRKQYLYHPRFRELRDLINFYRLLVVARALPPVRRHVSAQLRRRTLDRDRVVAGMIALLDRHLVRIGNEEYAEENDSYGLCTLSRKHLEVQARRASLRFPAKSGRPAEVVAEDPGIVRLLAELAAHRGPRLFTVDGRPIGADDVNAALAELSGERITAKDCRTWGGTLTAFRLLRGRADEPAPDQVILAAVDAAAAALGNTRSVARAHYIHPHVLASAPEGTLGEHLRRAPASRQPELSGDERALTGLLQVLFDDQLAARTAPKLA